MEHNKPALQKKCKHQMIKQQSSKLHYDGAIGRLDGYSYASANEEHTEAIPITTANLLQRWLRQSIVAKIAWVVPALFLASTAQATVINGIVNGPTPTGLPAGINDNNTVSIGNIAGQSVTGPNNTTIGIQAGQKP